MNYWEILFAIVGGLMVNELTDISPWLARKLVRWAAYRWPTDPGTTTVYAEEWSAIIEERPGKFFKLLTAAGFAGGALVRSNPLVRHTLQSRHVYIPDSGILDDQTYVHKEGWSFGIQTETITISLFVPRPSRTELWIFEGDESRRVRSHAKKN